MIELNSGCVERKTYTCSGATSCLELSTLPLRLIETSRSQLRMELLFPKHDLEKR